MIPEPNNQLETRVRGNGPGNDGEKGIQDVSRKHGGRKEIKQLKYAFELLFLVPNYSSTGLADLIRYFYERLSLFSDFVASHLSFAIHPLWIE